MHNAEAGWEELKKNSDTIITVPNDRLLGLMQKNSTLVDMMKMVDDVLLRYVADLMLKLLMVFVEIHVVKQDHTLLRWREPIEPFE